VGTLPAASVMVFTLYYQVTEDEQSDEMSMAEVTELIEAGTITDETIVYTDGMDDWGPFGEVKEELDWDEWGGYTSLYYQLVDADGETSPSEELDLAEILELCEKEAITDETLVFAEGMEDWAPFEEVKYNCDWPDGDDDEEDDGPPTLYVTCMNSSANQTEPLRSNTPASVPTG
jgi:hypothetical protein